jgi:DNA-binding beta-propeller fold protein YncE
MMKRQVLKYWSTPSLSGGSRLFFLLILNAAVLFSTQLKNNAYAGILLGTDVAADTLVAIDRDTSATRVIGPLLANVPPGRDDAMTGLAYDSNNRILYGINAGSQRLYSINHETGKANLVGTSSFGFSNANGLAFDTRRGRLLATDNTSNALFEINTVSGTGSLLAVLDCAFGAVEGLAYDYATDSLFGLSDISDRIGIINPSTGMVNLLPSGLPVGLWRGLEFDQERNRLYLTDVAGQDRLFQADPFSGESSLVGTLGSYESAMQGLAFIPSTVPEPSTFCIALGCLATILLQRRRFSR